MLEIFCILVVFSGYLLPWIIALFTQHKNATPILVSSIFFNWTGVGWVINLIWSLTTYE